MQSEISATFSPSAPKSGICVVDGYGLQILVNRRHLILRDGLGRHRRERRYARATSRPKRLVVLGHSGFVTLEALRWMSDVGIYFIQIDADGLVLTTSATVGNDDPRLRRAQGLAVSNPVGIAISRFVLSQKLQGQAQVLERIPNVEDARSKLEDAKQALADARSLDQLRLAEAAGATAYWSAWEHLAFNFGRQGDSKVPEHWKTFAKRSSPVTGQPRLAANPANAMLNYLYALLEAEARLACLTIGLDPGLGIIHADQRSRDSLALDLMEAARPEVDSYLLDQITSRVFSYRDFHETPQGVCRVLPPLSHGLAETAPAWAVTVAPIAERVATMLAEASTSRIKSIATPLTQDNRSAGREGIRRGPRKTSGAKPTPLPNACLSCGTAVKRSVRSYCDACLPLHEAEKLKRIQIAGPEALTRMRAKARDPMHREQSRRKVGERNLARMQEAAQWARENSGIVPNPAEFIRDIWPRIQGIPLRKLARLTGLSISYCSLIRQGKEVPHPRHWPAFSGIGSN